MKHKDKLKLARKLLTKEEKHTPVFQSKAWEARKEAIAKRVERVQAVAHSRALERKKKLSTNLKVS